MYFQTLNNLRKLNSTSEMLIFPNLDHICSEEYQDMCDAQIKTGALSTFVVVLTIFLAGVMLTITIFILKKEKALKYFRNCNKKGLDQNQCSTPTKDSADQPLKQIEKSGCQLDIQME